jgi:uncharacterized phage-associated protein
LTQQIVAAVEPQYIAAMRNRSTGQFTGTVHQLIQYILDVYGKITPSQLLELEHETKMFAYDPITPVDVVFNKVEDLVEYGEMARCDYTMGQTINTAYSILNRTTKFKESIKAWNRLPALQKTWIAFKTHFRDAHNELQETGKLTMADAGYHQANLVDAIPERVTDIHLNATPASTASSHITSTPDPLLPTILAQMQNMQQLMAAMQTGGTVPAAPAPAPAPTTRRTREARPHFFVQQVY